AGPIRRHLPRGGAGTDRLLREFGPPRESDHPGQPFWRLQRDGVSTVRTWRPTHWLPPGPARTLDAPPRPLGIPRRGPARGKGLGLHGPVGANLRISSPALKWSRSRW